MRTQIVFMLFCKGRERSDGLECWVAMTTEAFARQLLEEAPLTKNGAYVAQSQQYLSELAPRIWEALWGVLQPFSSGEPPLLLALLLLIGAQVFEKLNGRQFQATLQVYSWYDC
jgi:hypothetical protein